MGKILSLISGSVWPYVILLAIIGGLLWFGVEFSSRGAELKVSELRLRSVTNSKDSLQAVLKVERVGFVKAKNDRKADSVNYAKTIAATEKSCLDIKADRDYWKDYSDKLETGEYDVKMGVWPFKGKRLVPKKKD